MAWFIGQFLLVIVLAFLLGLLLGYVVWIWGWRKRVEDDVEITTDVREIAGGETARRTAELDARLAERDAALADREEALEQRDARIAELEDEVRRLRTAASAEVADRSPTAHHTDVGGGAVSSGSSHRTVAQDSGGDAGGVVGRDAAGVVGGDAAGVVGGDAGGVVGGDAEGVVGGDAAGVVGGDAAGVVGAAAEPEVRHEQGTLVVDDEEEVDDLRVVHLVDDPDDEHRDSEDEPAPSERRETPDGSGTADRRETPEGRATPREADTTDEVPRVAPDAPRAEADTGVASTVTAGTTTADPTTAGTSAAAPTTTGTTTVPDDLKRVEGIGPKMEAALHDSGVLTFGDLARTTEHEIRAAIVAAGMRFAPSVPTWATQAQMLADGDEEGLAAYQERLVAGREESRR